MLLTIIMARMTEIEIQSAEPLVNVSVKYVMAAMRTRTMLKGLMRASMMRSKAVCFLTIVISFLPNLWSFLAAEARFSPMGVFSGSGENSMANLLTRSLRLIELKFLRRRSVRSVLVGFLRRENNGISRLYQIWHCCKK